MEIIRPLLKTLTDRIKEKRNFIQVIAGPRQVGKTTLALQLYEKTKVFSRFYSADDMAEFGPAWIDGIWEALRVEMKLQKRKNALLIIDEIQKVPNWSETVKKNWDRDTRNKLELKLVLLGSSRLLLEDGLSESLLGRFELNYLGHWSYAEMREAFSFSPAQYIWFGGYPGAAGLVKNENRFKNFIANSVIEAALGRDVLMTTKVSKPALLRQLFEIGTLYSAQILSYNKMLGQLNEAGNTTTLARYLSLLGQAGLLAGLNKFSNRPIVEKLSIPKLQVCNTALTSAMRPESFADAQRNSALWGHLTESAVGAHLLNQVHANSGLKLFYWREKTAEMDFVITSGHNILGIEIKSNTAKISANNREKFTKAFPDSRLLLVGDSGIPFEQFMRASVKDLF